MKAGVEAYTQWQNEEERERVLLEQMPQVHYIARRIHGRLPRHVPLEDLVHAGVLGLLDALHKFDHGRQVQFRSYAKFRIRGAILDSLRELDWSPRELRRKGRRVEEAHQQLRVRLGRSPSENELAVEMGLPLRDFQALLAELKGLELGSLHVENASEGGRDEDLTENLPGAPEDSPFEHCLEGERRALLARLIAELPEKERQVLALYYFEELTMKEVGAVLGVGESRVSQIHSLAILRLRSRLHETSGSGVSAAAAGR